MNKGLISKRRFKEVYFSFIKEIEKLDESVKKFWKTKEYKIKEKGSNNNAKLIFLIFLIFYIIMGVQLSYNYDFTQIIDILFDSDTDRVINDISNIFGMHNRLMVHPLFVLISQPIYFILSGITQDKMLAIIFMSSVVSAISVTLMYKIFAIFSKSEKTSIILALCYGFTFSSIIFTAGIEVYNIATMGLILLWYFVIKKLKEDWKNADYIILIALGIFTLAVTITNYVIFLIGCLVLLLSKRIKFINLFLSNIIVIILFIELNGFQYCVWQNTPLIVNNVTEISKENKYINLDINADKVKNILKDDIYNPILATDINLSNGTDNSKIIKFNKIKLENKIILTIFLLITIIFTIKNFNKNSDINAGIILALIFNFSLHLLYGNSNCFLYSQHFIYLIFLLFGINCLCEKKTHTKVYILAILILLLISEIIKNNIIFMQILRILKNILPNNYFLKYYGVQKTIIATILIVSALSIILKLAYIFIKKLKDNIDSSNKFKYIIYLITLVILFESVFVLLKTIPQYEQIFGKPTISKSSKIIVPKENYRVFAESYENEVDSYLEYIKEYKDFINDYNCKIYSKIPSIEFYLFGMGNRKKILYKDGKLINVENKEIIKQFDVDEYLIIPNEYTVLIKQRDGQLKKICENEEGVFIETNSEKEFIDGTKININFYTFEKQKYKNIKKVLYSEILFNIKDSKIYPNIFVYDTPWYRDAAMACMVLKQTNNTDLIADWIPTITNIYDSQNDEDKEPDNLGELLYIISTQKDKNIELIEKIEKEAERIASSNPNGYYIYGNTDGGNEYKYQNMWYDFGMKSIGKESKFEYKDLKDNYSNLIWWIDNDTKNVTDDTRFPYLSWASYHAANISVVGKLIVNSKIYPLSWEQEASQANYKGMEIIDKSFVEDKISPVHVWTASEMLLLILDETNDLKM